MPAIAWYLEMMLRLANGMMRIRVVVDVMLSDMDKDTRRELVRKGYYVLRSQWDERRQCYKIVKATYNSGWSHFGNGWYITGEDCNRKIDDIVARDPKHFEKD